MENISDKNDFAIETEFGSSSTKEGELCVVAESDISVVTLRVREERSIIIEHDISRTGVRTGLIFVVHELENSGLGVLKLGFGKFAYG